jgi:hypothetical protein
MTKYIRSIQEIRIDIPLDSMCIYWFVRPSHSELEAWWGLFWEFLLTFASNELEWNISGSRESAFSRPGLSRSQRTDIVNFIRTAPKGQIASHRSLKRAVEMTPAQEDRLELVYFSNDIRGLE